MAAESNPILKLVTATSGLFLIAFNDSHKLRSGCDEGRKEIKNKVSVFMDFF